MSLTASHNTAPPLATSLNALSALHDGLDMRTGQTPGDEDWITACDLMHADSPHLNRLLALVEETYATPDRSIWVSFFMNSYGWLIAAASLGCYIVSGRAPSLAPSEVWLRFAPTGRATGITFARGGFWALPDDPAAGHSDATVVHDRAALRDTLRQQIEWHMHELIPVLRGKSSFGTRALWIIVADRCAGFLFWLHQQHPSVLGRSQLMQEVDTLIHASGSPFNNALTGICTMPGHALDRLVFQRGSCCLNYKRPHGRYCASCPITRPCHEPHG